MGDFGIVFFEDATRTRISSTYENVGSRDWMPGWAMGMRIEDLTSAFDVFCLGKVLWAMVSGKTRLRLWYFMDPEFDLARQFPDDDGVLWINRLLSGSVVERREDTWGSASRFASEARRTLTILERGGRIMTGGALRRCVMCGGGPYRQILGERSGPAAFRNFGIDPTSAHTFRVYQCQTCGNIQLFDVAPSPPAWEDLGR